MIGDYRCSPNCQHFSFPFFSLSLSLSDYHRYPVHGYGYIHSFTIDLLFHPSTDFLRFLAEIFPLFLPKAHEETKSIEVTTRHDFSPVDLGKGEEMRRGEKKRGEKRGSWSKEIPRTGRGKR